MSQLTELAILEPLILYNELSISKLTAQTGLSYPTVLSKLRMYPFIRRRMEGREIRVSIDKRALDSVYQFLMTLVTSPMKKGMLTLAYARRKKIANFLVGGECALQMQLYVKDADPTPVFEIRSPETKLLRKKLTRLFEKSAFGEKPTLELVKDGHIRAELSNHIGSVPISRPEKIVVDAISEKHSEVYIDQIIESLSNSRDRIDLLLLKNYASEKGVLDQTVERLESAGLTFP